MNGADTLRELIRASWCPVRALRLTAPLPSLRRTATLCCPVAGLPAASRCGRRHRGRYARLADADADLAALRELIEARGRDALAVSYTRGDHGLRFILL